MKHVFVTAALAALLSAAAPSAVHAQQHEPEEAARTRAKEARKADDRFCIEQTGSRIVAARNARSKSDQKECVNAGGRVYTREDIERSGSIDLQDALRRLDPSLR
jgi:outer membrane cobalamin receptor